VTNGCRILILASILTGCSVENSEDDSQHVREFTGYAMFGPHSPALFFPSSKRSDFLALAYDEAGLPTSVRRVTEYETTCTFHIFRVAVLGRRQANQGQRHPYVEAHSFTLVEEVSRAERDKFIEALGSAAITRDSVCPTQ